VARHNNQDVLDIIETSLKIEFGIEVFGKRNARQVALVRICGGYLIQIPGIDIPQSDGPAAPGKLQGERSAPGAGADNGNRSFFGGVVQCAPPLPPLPLLAAPPASASRCCLLCA